MKAKVGYAAGEIWNVLKTENGQTLSKIKTALKEKDFDDTVTLLALGWLLREDKVSFQEEKKGKVVNKLVFLK